MQDLHISTHSLVSRWVIPGVLYSHLLLYSRILLYWVSTSYILGAYRARWLLLLQLWCPSLTELPLFPPKSVDRLSPTPLPGIRRHYKKTRLWNAKKSVRVKCMEFNGNINFLAAFLDGLTTLERSEPLDVKNNDSSTAHAQNIHCRAANLSANYQFSRTACVGHWTVYIWINPCGSKLYLSSYADSILRSERLEL